MDTKETKQGQTFITGDFHGDARQVSHKSWPKGKDCKVGDVMIQNGDFGIIWDNVPSSEEKYWMEWLSEKKYEMLIVDGNHDNHPRILDLPITQKFGSDIRYYMNGEMTKPIYFAIRGNIYQINGKSYLTMGGALSIDKHLRQHSGPSQSWWEQELWSKEEETHCLNNLDAVNWEVDYVVTHTCPDSVIYYVIDGISEKFRDPTSRFFEFIANKLDFGKWSFGHFHTEREFTDAAGDKYQCHYKLIHEIE